MKFKSHVFVPTLCLFGAAVAVAAPQTVQTAQVTDPQYSNATVAISYPATVVELFTSQGCSSCPPTNKLVRDISTADGLLALSYSVDYWDYLGWKDTLGRPEFSKRQRDYGKKQFQGQVYTPQIILNGDTHAARFEPDAMKEHKLSNGSANLVLNKTDSGINVTANGQDGTLVEVRYTAGSQSVPVARGENRGRTITLANAVTSVKILGECDEDEEFKTVIAAPSQGEALAVLLQDGIGGPILVAANYNP